MGSTLGLASASAFATNPFFLVRDSSSADARDDTWRFRSRKMVAMGRPDSLLQAAVAVAKHAYAPYSRFAVGAAVETKDGSVFVGTNMENASYGLSMCAEVGALQAAVAVGKYDQIVRIAIAGGNRVGEVITPCGRCRQLIYEASLLRGVDIEVWCADKDLSVVESFKISELLPHGFGPKDLGSA